MSDVSFVLWNEITDKPFARLYFDTESKAIEHLRSIESAYPGTILKDIYARPVPNPLSVKPKSQPQESP
jgi:hypothetical protein